LHAINTNAMIRLFRVFTAALVCAALCAPQARAAGAPALWLVQGPKAKVYIFGTIHVMKAGVDWSTPVIDQALAQSDDLWLEVPDDLRDPTALMPQVKTLGFDPEHPLSTKISKEDVARLDTLLKANNYPSESAFEPFRPWLVALVVSLLPASKAGYTGGLGVDVTLRSRMVAAGKPIKGFETVSDQLHLLADLPQAQEVLFLHETLDQSGPGDAAGKVPGTDALESLWQNGDVEKVAQVESKMNAMDPALTAVLVTNRNANWAKQLDERLHGEGTSFVAVGMLHVSGPGSLIDDLTKLGYTVTRVE